MSVGLTKTVMRCHYRNLLDFEIVHHNDESLWGNIGMIANRSKFSLAQYTKSFPMQARSIARTFLRISDLMPAGPLESGRHSSSFLSSCFKNSSLVYYLMESIWAATGPCAKAVHQKIIATLNYCTVFKHISPSLLTSFTINLQF